jgi:hypothetical protein
VYVARYFKYSGDEVGGDFGVVEAVEVQAGLRCRGVIVEENERRPAGWGRRRKISRTRPATNLDVEGSEVNRCVAVTSLVQRRQCRVVLCEGQRSVPVRKKQGSPSCG